MRRILALLLIVTLLMGMTGIPVLAEDPPEPVFPEVTRIACELIELDGEDEETTRRGWFAEKDNTHTRGVAYVRQNSRYLVHLAVFGSVDGNEALLSDSFTLSPDQEGNVPLYDATAKVLTTNATNTGYSTGYAFIAAFTDANGAVFQYHLELQVHVGSLGLIQVRKPDGTAYSGGMNYGIFYRTETGGSGSHTDGTSYEGTMPVPFQDGFTNLNYAYIMGRPADNCAANSPFVDLTEKMASVPNALGYYDLGFLQFQAATVLVTPKTSTGDYWYGAILNLDWMVSDHELVQSGLHMVSMRIFSLNGEPVKLAHIGDQFAAASMQASAFESSEIPSDILTMPLDGTVVEPMSVTLQAKAENFIGNVLLPNGDTYPDALKERVNTYSRDITLELYDITDQAQIRKIQLDPRSNGTYGANLENGHKYQASLYFDLGDFDDADWDGEAGPDGLWDSDQVTFVYHQGLSVESWPEDDKPVLSNGTKLPFSSVDGKMQLDMKAKKPMARGYVKTGEAYPGNDEGIFLMLLDAQGEMVARGHVHGSNMFTPARTGLFLLGSILPEVANGTYTLRVSEPAVNLDYTGGDFPVLVQDGRAFLKDESGHALVEDTEGFVTLSLPASRVKGAITVQPQDAAMFANSFQRVYVNVFDEIGQFVGKGRVRGNGQFAVANLAPGRYVAQVFVSPFAVLATNGTSQYASSLKIPFEVPASGVATLSIPLQKVIGSGQVMATPEQAVGKGNWVRIFDEAMNELCAVSTDDSGRFSIPDFGKPRLLLKALGTNGLYDSVMTSYVVQEGAQSPVVLFLSQAQLTGHVVAGDADASEPGNWLADVDVYLYDSEGRFTAHMRDTGSGYAFGGLSAGSWYLQAVPVSPVAGYVQTGKIPVTVLEDGTVSQALRLPVCQIAGKVYDPEGGIHAGGWVWAMAADQVPVSVRVAADGSYAFGGLPAGSGWKLSADAEGTAFGGSQVLTVVVPAEGQPVVEQDIRLLAQASLQGVVLMGGTVCQQHDLYVYDAELNPVATLRTDWFGEFRLNGLENGTYRIVTRMADGTYAETSVAVPDAQVVIELD